MESDQLNHNFNMAVQFVNYTARDLFLTGKAGTGKTTFLKHIRETSPKKMAVVAPTGVAAINAGGVTIHSFFQLPLGSYLPGFRQIPYGNFHDRKGLLQHLRMNRDKQELIRELELLVIDEVSMVRADLLDAIDAVLRHIRRKPHLPFGGVQMLYIGDLFQLPPVVNEEDWKVLSEYYGGPFFFHAQALQQSPPVYIELDRIYRQSDASFIRLLNNIRDNRVTPEDLELLNQYYRPGFRPEKKGEYITLTTHNAKADIINQKELDKLPGRVHSFQAQIEGDFNERSVPAEITLNLKEGAQVMFIRNDKGEERRYYNGRIATVKKIDEGKIYVSFPDEPGEMLVEKETWRNVRYRYNNDIDQIEEDEAGKFTQYPIRLAWAITIHKSQGLTFDKAIIDAGASFAPGQVYVALSRLTSLEGLVLYSKIEAGCINTDIQALEFTDNSQNAEALPGELLRAQQKYINNLLLEAFLWDKQINSIEAFTADLAERQIPLKEEARELFRALSQKIQELKNTGEKFTVQLKQILDQGDRSHTILNERVQAACTYFCQALDKDLLLPLQEHDTKMQVRQKTKKYLKELHELRSKFRHKKYQMEQILQITAGLAKGTSLDEVLQVLGSAKEQQSKVSREETKKSGPKGKGKAGKGESHRISLNLFREGKNIEQIAEARGLATGTIEGHLTSFVLTGEVEVSELVPEYKINCIQKVIGELGEVPSSKIKEALGEEFSYGEIRAVMNHNKKILSQVEEAGIQR